MIRGSVTHHTSAVNDNCTVLSARKQEDSKEVRKLWHHMKEKWLPKVAGNLWHVCAIRLANYTVQQAQRSL